jgi:hypothetical protein
MKTAVAVTLPTFPSCGVATTLHDLLTEEEAQAFLKENALLRQKHPEAVKLPCLHFGNGFPTLRELSRSCSEF